MSEVSPGSTVSRAIANLDGDAALPRRNGELVFEAPWQGRAFGMAVAMHEAGTIGWDAFRDRLIERIAEGSPSYYESWLDALEGLVLAERLLDPAELDERARQYRDLERDPLV